MNTIKLLRLLLPVVVGFTVHAADSSGRIAIFDPVQGTIHNRFAINIDAYNAIEQTLQKAAFDVQRLTAQQIADPAVFNTDNFDAILFEGSSIPRSNIEPVKKFATAGGVMINVAASVPMLVAIEPDDKGLWQMSPMSPKFAWQISEMHIHFGIKCIYNPLMHDQGKVHAVTPLLATYLPNVKPPRHALPHRWLVTRGKGLFYPLINAQRVDGAEVTPQVFIAENEKARAIITLSPLLTDASKPDEWAHSAELLKALARIAIDLKKGSLTLSEDMAVTIPAQLPPPEPLRTRMPQSSVNPESAKAVKRWGVFNGSSLDLEKEKLPPRLLPGDTVTLDMPTLESKPAFLRIRMAYNASNAGLKIAIDRNVVLNELSVYNDPTGESNNALNLYSGLPVEMTRLVYLPIRGKTLTISNPGSAPIYFDALQIEHRTRETPERWVGTGSGGWGLKAGEQNPIPADVSRRWSVMRGGSQTQYVGAPGDPKRWDIFKLKMDETVRRNSRINMGLSGTPEWAAISPERYADGVKARRQRTVPPDPDKYAEIVEWIVKNYKDHIQVYEIWNEPDIQQFWRGTLKEYLTLCNKIVKVIKANDPDATIITAGLAHSEAEYVQTLRKADFAEQIDMIATHPYAAESVSWDIPYGKLQGMLYAMGEPLDIYCNESGFVWKKAEWFKGNWTEERQAEALSTAIARLLHGDITKLSTFHGGGGRHYFGMYDSKGKPRPAALVFEEYVNIAQPGARRLDVSLTPADGDVPLQGIYIAGSSYPDGRQSMIINPAESPIYSRQVKIRSHVIPALHLKASARADNIDIPVKLIENEGWIEVTLTINKRTLIELTPQRKTAD